MLFTERYRPGVLPGPGEQLLQTVTMRISGR